MQPDPTSDKPWRLFRLHKKLVSILALPPVAVIVLVTLFYLILENFFQMPIQGRGYLAELLVWTVVAYWLDALLRPRWLFLLTLSLLVGLLYMSNGFKFNFFGSPVLPTDFYSLPVLLDQTSGWRFLMMVAPLLLTAAALLAGLRLRWRTPLLLLSAGVLVFVVMYLDPAAVSTRLDARYGYNSFNPTENFEVRGPSIFLLNEFARRAGANRVPTQADVMAALQDAHLSEPLPPPVAQHPRDIYVFMMESFWDPSLLKSVHFSRDPLSPAFRKLWEKAGETKALVPVFGGGTANSEFEVLCGQPANDPETTFVTTLAQPVMCLPRILTRMGYRTDAATPDGYSLWNRGQALGFVGFQRFYTGANFDQTDRNGQMMANAPLFAQVDGLVALEPWSGPRLVYIDTDSGHYPYRLDDARRPPVIHSDSTNSLITGYANSVYYDSGELVDYINKILARDPDAVIVAFGDHLPVLGDGNRVYAQSGLMVRREADDTPQMLETHQSTPLLVIDGRRGPLNLGHISLFEVPRLVLTLLGVKQPTLLDAFTPPSHVHPRIREGRLLAVPDSGSPEFCTVESTSDMCRAVDRWYADILVLRADALRGHDYSGGVLYGVGSTRVTLPLGGPSYLSDHVFTTPCDIKITNWGPRSTHLGMRFNVQRSGNSSIWIRYVGKASDVHVEFGSTSLQVQGYSGFLSASLVGRLSLLIPGDRQVMLTCNGDPHPIELGMFHVGL